MALGLLLITPMPAPPVDAGLLFRLSFFLQDAQGCFLQDAQGCFLQDAQGCFLQALKAFPATA